tara:strand:+ start:404 stop:778 length:375 start_codon:yes stop_codon:yes gene_type:complete
MLSSLKFDIIYFKLNINNHIKMNNNYFPGIGLLNLMNGNSNANPSPEPEHESTPSVIYAEPIGENPEIIALKRQIKILEDKVRDLIHENNNLRSRIEIENKLEKIYENLPSLEQVGETLNNIGK